MKGSSSPAAVSGGALAPSMLATSARPSLRVEAENHSGAVRLYERACSVASKVL